MGFTYFKGSRWEDITRDERFFFQRLYELARTGEGLTKFLRLLNDKCGLALSLDVEWELGYEVCFYRDFWHWNSKQGKCFSPKRTFDLCLFSEKTIIIIEAKAQQPLKQDQVNDFLEDERALKEVLEGREVLLLGLISSIYQQFSDLNESGAKIHKDLINSFQGRVVTWKDLSETFGPDKLLSRADSLFKAEDLMTYGMNSTGKMFGKDLLEAAEANMPWIMGKNRGIRALDGLSQVEMLEMKFEVNTEMVEVPNRNWFRLEEFASAFAKATLAKQVNPNSAISHFDCEDKEE